MRKNSIYTSQTEMYTAVIKNNEGVVMFTKKLDDYQNAVSWCEGMMDHGHSYELLDSDTKRVLASGRNENGEIVKGTKVELEHRALIVEMLQKAGQEPTEEKIAKIASEIAKTHLEEDPQYYEKLEEVGL